MEPEIQKLEEELGGLAAAPLTPELRARLARAMAAPGTQATTEVVAAELAAIAPAPLSSEQRAAQLAVLQRVPYERPAKVVAFPAGKRVERRSRSFIAAAAAVAMAGALAAWWVQPPTTPPSAAAETAASPASHPTHGSETFRPASFESGVAATDDLGHVWTGGEKAMRVVKVVYKDRVVWINQQGEEVVAEVPRVEYLMVPGKVD